MEAKASLQGTPKYVLIVTTSILEPLLKYVWLIIDRFLVNDMDWHLSVFAIIQVYQHLLNSGFTVSDRVNFTRNHKIDREYKKSTIRDCRLIYNKI